MNTISIGRFLEANLALFAMLPGTASSQAWGNALQLWSGIGISNNYKLLIASSDLAALQSAADKMGEIVPTRFRHRRPVTEPSSLVADLTVLLEVSPHPDKQAAIQSLASWQTFPQAPRAGDGVAACGTSGAGLFQDLFSDPLVRVVTCYVDLLRSHLGNVFADYLYNFIIPIYPPEDHASMRTLLSFEALGKPVTAGDPVERGHDVGRSHDRDSLNGRTPTEEDQKKLRASNIPPIVYKRDKGGRVTHMSIESLTEAQVEVLATYARSVCGIPFPDFLSHLVKPGATIFLALARPATNVMERILLHQAFGILETIMNSSLFDPTSPS